MFGWIKDGFINTHYKANPILSKFPQVRFNPNNILEYGFKSNQGGPPEKIINNFSYEVLRLSKPLSHFIIMTDLALEATGAGEESKHRYFIFDSNQLLIEFWENGYIYNMAGKRLSNSDAYKWFTGNDLEMLNLRLSEFSWRIDRMRLS